MKTIGTILIIICFILNGFIGLFLYGKSLEQNPPTDVSLIKEHRYDKYGFSFSAPAKFKSGQSDIANGMIDYLYYSNNGNLAETGILIYVFENQQEGDITDGKVYESLSAEEFANMSKDLKVNYFNGGIAINLNGIKMYYDVFSEALDDGAGKVVKEKAYTFYHANKKYQIVLQDDPSLFDKNIEEYEKLINTVKVF